MAEMPRIEELVTIEAVGILSIKNVGRNASERENNEMEESYD
ncbi:MAG: hypothetical protein ACPK7O_06810 [Methanobacterium sp.]